MLQFLRSRKAQVVSIVLLVMSGVFYTRAAGEYIPPAPPIAALPREIDSWKMVQESEVDPQVQSQLKADQSLNRTYAEGTTAANLFIAFYRTQRAGVSPHSPKVCLPGAGWEPVKSDTINIPLQGRSPLAASRYVIRRGDTSSLVIYWFQTAHRSIPNEYQARGYLMLDGLRYHRSDTALVRVIVPIQNDNLDVAMATANRFVQSVFPPVISVLPS